LLEAEAVLLAVEVAAEQVALKLLQVLVLPLELLMRLP
jgi:hypothetical protein